MATIRKEAFLSINKKAGEPRANEPTNQTASHKGVIFMNAAMNILSPFNTKRQLTSNNPASLAKKVKMLYPKTESLQIVKTNGKWRATIQ